MKKIAAFCAQREGVSAIEFSFIAAPFFLLLFAIIETGYLFLLSFLLEDAAAEGARQVRTGTVQAATDFEAPVCNGMLGLVDCNDLHYDAYTFANFGAISLPAAPTDKGSNFSVGSAGSIVVVRVALPWTYMTPFLQNLMGPGTGSGTLLASVVIQTEPY